MHEKIEAEAGVLQKQAKGCQRLLAMPDAGERDGSFPVGSLRVHAPTDILILNFWPPEP